MSGIGRTTVSTVFTGDQKIDGLMRDNHWSASSITYSFPVNFSEYATNYYQGTATNNFAAVSAAQQTATFLLWIPIKGRRLQQDSL